MNAVDTGWINDENPLARARETADKGFQTPLDEIDAAARILDPVFGPLNGEENRYGKFYKVRGRQVLLICFVVSSRSNSNF